MVGAVAAAVAAAPFVLAVAPAVYLAFRAVKAEVVTSMTVLKRLDGVCKSPVLSAFSGTLRGLVTTRAYPHAGERQGRKRVRNSQLQRLRSRSISTRFG